VPRGYRSSVATWVTSGSDPGDARDAMHDPRRFRPGSAGQMTIPEPGGCKAVGRRMLVCFAGTNRASCVPAG